MSDRSTMSGYGLAGRRKSAFTLVELLVVIGIIAVLIAILLPALSRARRSALSLQCMSNPRQWGLGMQMYANDFHGVVPLAYSGEVLGYARSGSAVVLWAQWLNEIQYISGGGEAPNGDRTFEMGGIGICPEYPMPVPEFPEDGWLTTWSSTYAANGYFDYAEPAGLGLGWRTAFAPVKKIRRASEVMLVSEIKLVRGNQIALIDPDQGGAMPQFTLAQRHPNNSSSVLFADGHVENMSLKSFGGWSYDYSAQPDRLPSPWKAFP